MSHGFAHLGLGTHDMAATIAFYEGMLGFARVADVQNRVSDGGVVRMVYFECGPDQYFVFMEASGVANIPDDYDTSINGALGVPAGLYHFALRLPTVAALHEKKVALESRGLAISGPVDHGYAQSIFVRDPNDLQVEFCCMTRAFNASDLSQHHDVVVTEPSTKRDRKNS